MALERLLDVSPDAVLPPDALYTHLTFPDAPEDRPYLYINMVSTADGKILIKDVGQTAAGVGGPTDQLLFRRLQRTCDAALIGSSTVRAGKVLYPKEIARFVVTRTGDLPLDNPFFTDAPDRACILAPEDLPEDVKSRLSARTNLICIGQGDVDLTAAMKILRQKQGVRRLLCEGGATLNDALIRAGLADELFLTLTNKLKGGKHLPTPVDGAGFPPGVYLPMTLLSLYHDGDELYLRYRLASTPTRA